MTNAPTTPDTETPRIVRHRWIGSTFTVLGQVTVQIDRPLIDGDKLIVYRDVSGDLWARLPHEFEDGRFEDVTAAGYTITPTVRDGAGRVAYEWCEAEARRYATFYSPNSDGRNTFILLAERIERRAAADAVAAPGGEADARDAARYRWLKANGGYRPITVAFLDEFIDQELTKAANPDPPHDPSC